MAKTKGDNGGLTPPPPRLAQTKKVKKDAKPKKED